MTQTAAAKARRLEFVRISAQTDAEEAHAQLTAQVVRDIGRVMPATERDRQITVLHIKRMDAAFAMFDAYDRLAKN